MKKINLLLLFVGLLTYTQAQVGINTTNPQGVFHIHTGNTTNTKNDVIVTTAGNLGIGTVSPSVKLDINTGGTSTTPIEGFKLVDGNQGLNKVLTSNQDGVGTWSVVGFSEYSVIEGHSIDLEFDADEHFYYTGFSFTLKSKGTYLITLGIQLRIFNNELDFLNNVRIPLQLKPTSNPAHWVEPSVRFSGAYECYPTLGTAIAASGGDARGNYVLDNRYYLTQAITSLSDDQVVYLLLWTSIPNNSFATLSLGETGGQGTGGAYVQIN